MSLRNAVILGLGSFVALITGLQLWLNPTEGNDRSFRVGFLPVT